MSSENVEVVVGEKERLNGREKKSYVGWKYGVTGGKKGKVEGMEK